MFRIFNLLFLHLITHFFSLTALAQPGDFNDLRMGQAVDILLRLMEGGFGAIVMSVAGLIAIFNAVMGNYKASLSLLVVALSTFILKSVIATFFNTGTIPGF